MTYRRSDWASDRTEKLSFGGCVLLVLIFICLTIVPASWCWDYTVSRWLVYMGKPDNFHMWPHGVLLSIIPGLGQFVFILAALTWLSTFFM